jgi:predicted SAM-dependent methyltransferase
MIYLNCGSGQRPFKPPFVNIEAQEKWRGPTEAVGCNFTLGDATELPYCNFEVDLIVSHHCLEHCTPEESDAFMNEAYRTLKTGGSLIICVPNLRALAQRWLTGQLPTHLYTVNLYGAYMGDEHDRHKQGWDQTTLREYVAKWPWASVKAFDFRFIEGADIAAHDFWIQETECIK